MQVSLEARDNLTIARILKVNHAGEYGAIRIYRAQIFVSRWFYPDLVAHLTEMLGHEIEHCRLFREAMPVRSARPCRIMSLWGWGGSLLGLMTALMGRQSIWTTTAAVEETVHRHLDDQLNFLSGRDVELFGVIEGIREEELSHLRTAEKHIEGSTAMRRAIRQTICIVTEAMIWLSTWGDSSRMALELEASKRNR